ncbi:MAG TPA: class I SAM-dependent methyltransferase [Solirubrobacterales bacterium]|jgi:ubiquinone/menaquinone biosynthesis C-methylase UbiE|nr:class I SAM-dependent methyltransferase [Solirubrobacterales bacterium]
MPNRIYEATWGRAFAALYDRSLKATEQAGLRRMRVELLGGASGRTLELGAGTGVNLDLYPGAVGDLVLAEPDPHMAKRLRARAAELGRTVEVLEAPAEQLPLADHSFDTVVGTLVLCTVPDPEAALAEAARILRPGGRFLFIEHVRAEDASLARWQDRLEKPWRFLGDGCHCNRDTVATIEASPLALESVERGRLPKAPPIVKPLIRGSATLAPGQS